MRTYPTLVRTHHLSGDWFSTSTTLTRRCLAHSSGCQATRSKLRRSRTGQRVYQEAVPQGHAGCSGELPHSNASFAAQPILTIWYAHLNIEQAVAEYKSTLTARKLKERKERLKATEGALTKARTRDSLQAMGKLTAVVDGKRQIISNPPLVVRLDEMIDLHPDEVRSDSGPSSPATATRFHPTADACSITLPSSTLHTK